MYDIILQILIIIHILVWIYAIFGGFISKDHAKFIIYYFIPLIYILHLLPFHIIVSTKLRIIESDVNVTDSTEYLHTLEHNNIIIYLFDKLHKLFEKSFKNPLSPQGLLILGFIVNIYLLKYYYNEYT